MLMMLPFEAPTVFEGIHKSYFRMPRVVRDQRNRFENDDLFRQLSHESAVKYTGFKDRPLEERQVKFIANCQEGHTEVSVVQSGNQFTLMFNPAANPAFSNEGCDFDKEVGKVHIKAGFILNGVCVLWRGWIDLQRLEGFGCLEFDEYRAYLEDAMVKQQIDKQQSCNTNGVASNGTAGGLLPPPPPGMRHHPLGPPPPPPPPMNHAAAAAAAVAAVTTNSMLPGAPPQLGLSGPSPSPLSTNGPAPPPPVSFADSAAAHYGNAAIAAAAAAAFHQALAVGGPPPPALGHPQSQYNGLSGPNPSALAAAAAAAAASNGLHGPPPPHSLVSHAPHLSYTPANGLGGGPQQAPPSRASNHSPRSNSSPRQFGATANSANSPARSPERENYHHKEAQQNSAASKRQAVKRPQQDSVEQTQLDEVDVVSDISAHDLDFPPRRIFKSAEGLAQHHHHHHHNHNHHHHNSHKISRRAA